MHLCILTNIIECDCCDRVIIQLIIFQNMTLRQSLHNIIECAMNSNYNRGIIQSIIFQNMTPKLYLHDGGILIASESFFFRSSAAAVRPSGCSESRSYVDDLDHGRPRALFLPRRNTIPTLKRGFKEDIQNSS